MTMLQFYPIDVTYKVLAGRAVVHIYGRTVENKQICIIDDAFEPYFYVIPENGASASDLMTLLENYKNGEEGKENKVTSVKQVVKTLNGRDEDAIQVFVNLPRAVPGMRHEISKMEGVKSVLEYDIFFTRRYLVDRKIVPLILTDVETEPIENPKRSRVPCFKAKSITQNSNDSLDELNILAFDIETYNPEGRLSLPEKHPIIMLSLYGKNFKKVITWKRFNADLDYIEFVDGEAELIERFKEIVNEISPDLLVGYYSDGFDLPYIIKRGEKYKIKIDIGLDYDKAVLPRGNAKSIDTTGIVHVDILNFIKRVISRRLKTDSMKLNAVAGELLGEVKDDVDIEGLAEAWDTLSPELKNYAKYNLQDSKLTYDLCEKVLPNLIELVKLIGQTIKDTNRMSYSQLVEWYIIRRADEFNQFIPNRPHHKELEKRMSERVKGAFVYEPKPGLYEGVVVFDFRSLYPTIIVSHNISIETLNCDCCKEKEKVPLDTKQLWFCSKKEGFFSTVLKEIITRRMRVKEIMKKSDEKKRVFLDARQESLKTLSNSFYGYLGFFAARWYSKDCARSVTAYGRHYIHRVIDGAKKKGFDVLYSDTDSVFMHLNDKTEKDALNFCDEINAKLPGMMELEYEGTYPRALFVAVKESGVGAKKKYALIDQKGQLVIKGFETVRRNVSPIAKATQEKVLRIVLQDNNPKKAFEFVRDVVTRLKEKRVGTEDLTIPTRLTRSIDSYESIGPHVAAAKRLKERGVEIYPGMIVRYVVTSNGQKIRDKVRLPEEVRKGEYDSDYYINNQVLPAVEKILEVFNYSSDDISKGKKQSKLGQYF
ncbi:ribonuclease H-like domain-containing protein [Candidatus Woesearchaeota archaeon]|nr:ribonuclease H-like domain-containing protein [Candidatus Woesearchaeota archaeon]